MGSDEAPVFQLLVCGAIFCLFLIYPWVRRVVSVGLPLCYIISLAMIHWLGGFIHILPGEWHSRPDPYTLIGFTQAFWGTVAFSLGSFLVAPFLLRLLVRGETAPVIQAPS